MPATGYIDLPKIINWSVAGQMPGEYVLLEMRTRKCEIAVLLCYQAESIDDGKNNRDEKDNTKTLAIMVLESAFS